MNSLLLWEGYFYDRLSDALEENNKNQKIENEIKEKLEKIKNLLDINKAVELLTKKRKKY